MDNLISEFDRAMHDVYRKAKNEAGYRARIFRKMLHRQGGLATAKQLINAPNVSDGYTALWERGRINLTVEAVVVENRKYHELFTADELLKPYPLTV